MRSLPEFDSRLPCWSTIEIDLGVSSGTLDDTRWLIAATWPSSMARPGYSCSTIEAVGFWRSRTNSVGLGIARCTRADCTAAIDSIERASSPSSPRW
ncbi:hypothetical protein D3C72_1214750 [compost metagenome]